MSDSDRDHPGAVSSLVFLDFSKLLALGERSGLRSSRTCQSVAADLRKVHGIGAHTFGNGSESTAEISLLIP